MGSAERRQRQRSRVREAILGAARDILTSEGVRAVSLRRIADRIDYSPAVFYTYFRCKEDIYLALAEAESITLERRLHEATQEIVDPLGRVRRSLWVLYEFLTTNPVFLELRAAPGAGLEGHGVWWIERSGGAAAALETDLEHCMACGRVSGHATAAVARRLLWLAMIGAAAVAPRRRADAGEHGDALARALLETLLAGVCRATSRPPASDSTTSVSIR